MIFIFYLENVVCYVADWTAWREGPGRFDIDNVDTNLCTHVIYAFASLDDNNGVADPIRGTEGMEKLKNLKNGNQNIKIMAAVGGWSEGSTKFSKIASSEDSRNQFVQSAISFMNKWNLDGLDIDWEYPTQGDGASPQDRDNYIEFLRALKAGFSSQPQNFLVSAAVAAGESTASQAYKINEMSQSLDFINLMAYDLHGSWELQTGMHSGLYGAAPGEPLTVVSLDNFLVSKSSNYIQSINKVSRSTEKKKATVQRLVIELNLWLTNNYFKISFRILLLITGLIKAVHLKN